MDKNLTQDLKNRINYVYQYIENETNDWFKLKKELINIFPINKRHLFSRRHKTSKKFFINDFDKEVIRHWEQISNNSVFIDQGKLHTKEDERMPKYWGLMKYNEQRRKNKEQRQK